MTNCVCSKLSGSLHGQRNCVSQNSGSLHGRRTESEFRFASRLPQADTLLCSAAFAVLVNCCSRCGQWHCLGNVTWCAGEQVHASRCLPEQVWKYGTKPEWEYCWQQHDSYRLHQQTCTASAVRRASTRCFVLHTIQVVHTLCYRILQQRSSCPPVQQHSFSLTSASMDKPTFRPPSAPPATPPLISYQSPFGNISQSSCYSSVTCCWGRSACVRASLATL